MWGSFQLHSEPKPDTNAPEPDDADVEASTSFRGLSFQVVAAYGCRRRHADVLEWAWFLQTNFDSLAGKLYGDKDLFELAFHLANKSAEFDQASPCIYCSHQQLCVGMRPAKLGDHQPFRAYVNHASCHSDSYIFCWDSGLDSSFVALSGWAGAAVCCS